LQSALGAAQERDQQMEDVMEVILGGKTHATEQAFGVDSADASRGELLAVVVEHLGEVVPDVQVLVLPVLLPSGR
jgi:hypothetical protein